MKSIKIEYTLQSEALGNLIQSYTNAFRLLNATNETMMTMFSIKDSTYVDYLQKLTIVYHEFEREVGHNAETRALFTDAIERDSLFTIDDYARPISYYDIINKCTALWIKAMFIKKGLTATLDEIVRFDYNHSHYCTYPVVVVSFKEQQDDVLVVTSDYLDDYRIIQDIL